MSKFEELINEYCPNGVEYKELKDILKIRNGSDYKSFPAGDVPVYGSGGIMTYIDRYSYNKPSVLIPRKGSIDKLYYVDTPFWNVDTIFYTEIYDDIAIPKYVYHCLLREHLEQYNTAGGVPSLTQTVLNKVSIPVPPLPVQQEIVRILDSFTELTAELTAEYQKQKSLSQQMSLQLFEKMREKGIYQKIGDCCKVEKGNTPIQKAVPGIYPMVVTTSERKTNDSYQFDTNAVCIPLVSSRGHGVASLNHVYYQSGKFALGNILCAVIPNDEAVLLAKYLYYFFEQTKDYTLVPLMKGGANVALHINDILRITIPIPSIDEQQRIIRILEVFEEYCNCLLPSEIEARKLQYEYYRDKLLTFKEKN